MPVFTLPQYCPLLLGVAAHLLLAAPTPAALEATHAAAWLATTATATPPVANDDELTRSYTATVPISVLANDLAGDTPLNPATVQLLGQPPGTTNIPGSNGGTFSAASSGQVSVVPPLFTGPSLSTSIGYTVQDQASLTSNQATLRLTFTNAAPVATADVATTATNTTATISVLANDTDADGNATIAASSVVLDTPVGTNGGGTFTVNSAGVVSFEPTGGFFGTTSTSYTVQDELGRRSAAATITVTVTNAAPVANRDVASTTAGTPVQIPVLNNDTDANGYATIVPSTVVLSPANGVTTGGTFVADPVTGVVTFTPSAGSTGATIGYRVKDNQGALSNSTNLTVSITTVVADVQATLGVPATAPAGAWVQFTLTLTNNSAVAATSVQGRVRLPGYLSQVTASHNAVYVPSTGMVSFPSANLAANSSRVHTIRVLMPASGMVVGTGSSTATSADPVPTNNDGSPLASSASTGPTQVADVGATITGPTTAPAGGLLSYRLMAINYGPSTATGVALKAQFPADLSGVTVTGGGSYDPASGLVTLPTAPSLTVGNAACFMLTMPVPSSTGTTLTGRLTATSTTADGDPTPENNNGTNALATATTTITSSTTASTYCPSSPTATATTASGDQLNTYYPGQLTASGTRVTVGPALATPGAAAIQPGDLVLLMQMQGADFDYTNTSAYGDGLGYADVPASGSLVNSGLTAGRYEYRYVTASSVTAAAGGVLTLASPLTNTYTNADATATAGQRRYQVVRVPRYQDLTLAADLSPAPWNGRTGGVLVLEVANTLDFGGRKIDARGQGFRGGGSYYMGGPATGGATIDDYVAPYASAVHATKGEGLAGTPRLVNNAGVLLNTGSEGYPGGSMGRGAPGNAGGGGTDGSIATNQNNTGGGGGSNGGFGGTGGHAWYLDYATGGNGGTPFLVAAPDRVALGGGGGAGSSNNGTGGSGQAVLVNNGFNSSGSAGGGIVLLRAGRMAGPGTIDVSGNDTTLPVDNDGGGGGGAGGSVVLVSSGSLSDITVLANGGRGGSNNLAVTAPHGPGGGGSAGVVFASSALHAASQALPGANGVTGSTNGNISFGAGPGTQIMPLWRTNVVASELPLPGTCQLVSPAAQPLPVRLVSFEALPQGAHTYLSWATAQELHNDRFEVERSTNGQQFAQIGSLPGAGTSSAARAYHFTDVGASAVARQLYYRLRQVDTNGEFIYSPVRVVSFPVVAAPLLLPNPAAETAVLDLSGLPSTRYTVQVLNTLGQCLLSYQDLPNLPLNISVQHLPTGTYLVKVQSPTACWVQRLVRQ
jgi:hypothetical protein